MKLITAIIRPDRLDHVKDALKAAGVGGMTVIDTKGFGRQGGEAETYRGANYVMDTIPKTQIKVVVGDEDLGRVVGTLVGAARTGKIGDGKVWITDVHHVIRIRTGEEDIDAI